LGQLSWFYSLLRIKDIGVFKIFSLKIVFTNFFTADTRQAQRSRFWARVSYICICICFNNYFMLFL
ncbi:hypothetical protein F4703DRAFT_1883220, partial [Phycomyces blakesleeanus]